MAGWLEDVLASMRGGTQSGMLASPFPEIPPPVDEAALAEEARVAAGKRLMGANQRRINPFGMPDAQSAGIQLGLGNAPEGIGVPFGSLVPGPTIPQATLPPPMAPDVPPAMAGPIPLPRPRPDAAPDGESDVTDISAQSKIPANAAPMAGQMPFAPPAPPSFGDRLGQGINDNAPLLLALAGGFGGASSFGEGMHRAFSNAAPIAQANQAQQVIQQGMNQTARALLAKGAPAEDVAAATRNPELMKALLGQYYAKDKGAKLDKIKRPDGSEVPVWVDPDKQTVTKADIPGAQNDGGPPVLNEQQKLRVQAIIDGREPYPSPNTRSGDAQFIREAVHAADPNFDAVNYTSRQKTRSDFAAGKSAQNLTSFNTTIGHLGTLNDAVEGLHNSNFPTYNRLANAVSGEFDPKFQANVKKFQAARTAVADELTRSFRGSGGNVHDIKAWEATINAADSPAALKAAIQQAAELLNSRVEAVGDQYNRGMGTTKDPMELLNPHAAESFKKLREGDMSTRATSATKPLSSGKTSSGISWSVN